MSFVVNFFSFIYVFSISSRRLFGNPSLHIVSVCADYGISSVAGFSCFSVCRPPRITWCNYSFWDSSI